MLAPDAAQSISSRSLEVSVPPGPTMSQSVATALRSVRLLLLFDLRSGMAEQTPAQPPQTPRIVVDSDWKSQARAEKERLAAAERARAEQHKARAPEPGPTERAGIGGGGGGGAGGGPAGAAGQASAPEEEFAGADFPSLVGVLASQAMLYLGGIPDPQTGRAVVSLDHARLHIDLLQVLEQKTCGNLTEDEARDLATVLYQLRMRYVEMTRAVAEALAKRKAAGAAAPPAPGA
jgi:hypothetical protein